MEVLVPSVLFLVLMVLLALVFWLLDRQQRMRSLLQDAWVVIDDFRFVSEQRSRALKGLASTVYAVEGLAKDRGRKWASDVRDSGLVFGRAGVEPPAPWRPPGAQ